MQILTEFKKDFNEKFEKKLNNLYNQLTYITSTPEFRRHLQSPKYLEIQNKINKRNNRYNPKDCTYISDIQKLYNERSKIINSIYGSITDTEFVEIRNKISDVIHQRDKAMLAALVRYQRTSQQRSNCIDNEYLTEIKKLRKNYKDG